MSNIVPVTGTTDVTQVVGPALMDKKSRIKYLTANPRSYVSHALKAIESDIQDYDKSVVKSDSDRLVDAETKNKAAQEYLELIAMQDYISHRIEEIKGAFYNTLDERDLDSVEEAPEWATEAPANVVPGEIDVEEVGIKFQRAGGAPKEVTVDERELKREHPRIYKSFMTETVIPATEEQVIETFDVDAFLERAKKDSSLRKFVSQKYGTVSFRVHNIFDN